MHTFAKRLVILLVSLHLSTILTSALVENTVAEALQLNGQDPLGVLSRRYPSLAFTSEHPRLQFANVHPPILSVSGVLDVDVSGRRRASGNNNQSIVSYRGGRPVCLTSECLRAGKSYYLN
jgi:hypothetical protein